MKANSILETIGNTPHVKNQQVIRTGLYCMGKT